MQIDIFTLCDSSQVYEGKMVIMGALSNIAANSVPFNVPMITLAARMSYDDSDLGCKTFSLYVSSPNGKTIVGPFNNQMDLEKKAPGLANVNINIVLNNITFEEFGTYTAILNVDGKEYKRVFTVTELK